MREAPYSQLSLTCDTYEATPRRTVASSTPDESVCSHSRLLAKFDASILMEVPLQVKAALKCHARCFKIFNRVNVANKSSTLKHASRFCPRDELLGIRE